MRTINIGSELSYQINAPTSFLFQVAATQDRFQFISDESLTVSPDTDVQTCSTGLLGNRMHRLLAVPGQLIVRYLATVSLEHYQAPVTGLDEVQHARLPADVLPFLNPSRYCESDKLMQFAWEEFGAMPAGYTRVQHITEWVHDYLSYTPGSTGPTTTACDVILQRQGVCRDYAHVAIALCRSLGIPARYVAGYAVDLQPPDFHSFFEAYLNNSWFLFDATQLAPVSGFVRIGTGRDAADVSFATLLGSAFSTGMRVWAFDRDGGAVPPGLNAGESSDALSTADV